MGLPDFSCRASLSEWMDDDAVDFDTFAGCLRDLAKVNVVTLAHRPTLAFLAQLARTGRWPKDRPLSVVDVGSGYGDGLRAIQHWASRRGLDINLTGLDRNPWSAQAAQAASGPHSPIAWLTSDVFDYAGEPDVIISSLFTHHLDDWQLTRFLGLMDRRAQIGWLVNDLLRSPVAYCGFTLLSQLMRWHPFVRHDGPVSILRAFRPADWRRYLKEAQVEGAQVRRRFPLRLCVAKLQP
ncbi:MAG TPA: methyltransferase domain-containing protein [Caulobacteraceae bacterium]|nr:methyltransferase domain-containing protein [Caulobacteraceae bacterium]